MYCTLYHVSCVSKTCVALLPGYFQQVWSLKRERGFLVLLRPTDCDFREGLEWDEPTGAVGTVGGFYPCHHFFMCEYVINFIVFA